MRAQIVRAEQALERFHEAFDQADLHAQEAELASRQPTTPHRR